MRFKVGDHVVWNKIHSHTTRISKIFCTVVKSNPCSYRVQYFDPIYGFVEKTAGVYNVVPFAGDWEKEKLNLNMVRYGAAAKRRKKEPMPLPG